MDHNFLHNIPCSFHSHHNFGEHFDTLDFDMIVLNEVVVAAMPVVGVAVVAVAVAVVVIEVGNYLIMYLVYFAFESLKEYFY